VAARFGWSLALVARRSITVWPTGPRRFAHLSGASDAALSNI
jgi:hypothetical protein